MGQIWNAAYNHAGAITDKSFYFGDSGTGSRHGNALSYAFSSGAVGFQLDLISDGGSDTGKAVDKTEFGMTIGIGEVGKVAIAHTNVRDTMTMMPLSYWVGDDNSLEAHMISVTVANTDINSHVSDGMLTTAGINAILETNGEYRTGNIDGCAAAAEDTDDTNDCQTVTAYVTRTDTSSGPDSATSDNENVISHTVTETYFAEAEELAAHSVVDSAGHKATHVAVEFSLGGVTPHLGYSTKEMNGTGAETKTTHYGFSGSLGDTGMGYLVAARSVKDADGMKSSPWLVNVSKGLGGGATVIFEHGNNDDGKSGKSRVGLHVTF